MKQNNHTEVMEVETEEMLPENPLERVIETALVKANITEQVIAKLGETYGGMKLASIDDKESYLEIKDARREVRKVGILTEKITKKGREDAIRVQRLWLEKEKEILGKIAKIQDPLDKEIEKFEDEVERKETEEKRKREEAFMLRQASLLKYGAEYRDGSYELGELSYQMELIKQTDDEMWEGVILPKYRKVYERKEADRVAEEAKRKADADRMKAEQERFAAEQKAFREQQEQFEKQQRELRAQMEEQNRKQRELEQRKLQEETQKQLAVKMKEEFEAKRQADMEMAAKKEQERLAMEEARREKQKKELEEEKQRQIEAAKDKVKYEVVVEYLLKCPVFEMKSSIYKHKMNNIKDFIADLKEN